MSCACEGSTFWQSNFPKCRTLPLRVTSTVFCFCVFHSISLAMHFMPSSLIKLQYDPTLDHNQHCWANVPQGGTHPVQWGDAGIINHLSLSAVQELFLSTLSAWQELHVRADHKMGMEGSQEEMGGGACLIFFSLCFSCIHFLHGNSCQNVVGLQHTTKLLLILEPGTGQEVRRSPRSRVH